jgi:predicted nucleotide-binding protein (sugar kinase/HSP70/actin superfamily)
VDVAAQPGRGIGRQIGRGEAVEHELDAFIAKRHEQRVKTEGERAIEAAWRESERREEARRREENRLAWCDYFERLSACLRVRPQEYDQRAQTLMETDQPKGA